MTTDAPLACVFARAILARQAACPLATVALVGEASDPFAPRPWRTPTARRCTRSFASARGSRCGCLRRECRCHTPRRFACNAAGCAGWPPRWAKPTPRHPISTRWSRVPATPSTGCPASRSPPWLPPWSAGRAAARGRRERPAVTPSLAPILSASRPTATCRTPGTPRTSPCAPTCSRCASTTAGRTTCRSEPFRRAPTWPAGSPSARRCGNPWQRPTGPAFRCPPARPTPSTWKR